MSMKPYKKLVATVGTYQDSQGNEKNRYIRVGTLFLREDNSVCMKLDSLPAGNEWQGWINAYDLDEDRAENNANGMKQVKAAVAAPAAPAAPSFDDEIPF